MNVPIETGLYLAQLELDGLRKSGETAGLFDGLAIMGKGTPLYDLDDTLLLFRFPVWRNDHAIGYADVSVEEDLGNPLQRVVVDLAWNEDVVLNNVLAELGVIGEEGLVCKFVVYSYPKVGVQVSRGNVEVGLLEWSSLIRIGEVVRDEFGEVLYPVRYSLLDSMRPAERARNREKFHQLNSIFSRAISELESLTVGLFIEQGVSPERLANVVSGMDAIPEVKSIKSGFLRHAASFPSPLICFEGVGQMRDVWCVAACVQMILSFYRYEYNQEDVAKALDLGTLSSPHALFPNRQQFEVVSALEELSSDSLVAWLNPCPHSFWGDIIAEIDANRPLIITNGEHARVVAGYMRVDFETGQYSKLGLLLYNPLPIYSGKPEPWQDFDPAKFVLLFGASPRRPII